MAFRCHVAAQVGREVPHADQWRRYNRVLAAPELPAWEAPKRNPHERRPRAPEWKPEAAAEIAGLAAASDDVAGADVAA